VLKKDLTRPAGLLEKGQSSDCGIPETPLIMIITFFAVIGDIKPLGFCLL
jgi:hypothetical protein